MNTSNLEKLKGSSEVCVYVCVCCGLLDLGCGVGLMVTGAL